MDLTTTRELCRGSDTCDPLFDTRDPAGEARLFEQDGALILPGSSDAEGERGYADDLRITPSPGGWRLDYRDPEGAAEPLYGRNWIAAGFYTNWADLVSFAYCL